MKKVLYTLLALGVVVSSMATQPCKVSFFGSSVCNGVGADSLHGYAWLLDSVWQATDQPFYRSNISVNGNNTIRLMERYERDLLPDSSDIVVIGLGLGNEGLHASPNPDSVYNQWKTNMLALISRLQADGKQVVVTNNYPRGDYTERDFDYICRMNLEMQRWSVPTISFLGVLLNDQGNGRWPEQTIVPGDIWHPNGLGHHQMMFAFPGGLFEALQSGKPMPQYRPSRGTRNVSFEMLAAPAGRMFSSFTQAYVQDRDVYIMVSNRMSGYVSLYKNGRLLTHCPIREFVPLKRPKTYTLSQYCFYVAALTPMEIAQLTLALRGKAPLLTSSLALYCPLDHGDLTNYAQSSFTLTIR